MATITSRQNLIDYCLRRLGAPVLEINVDDDQMNDRIDEALTYYQNFHSDAIVRNFYRYTITQQDYTNQSITLPDQILYVLRILPLNQANSTQGIFSVDYQLHLNDLYDLRRPGNLINYEMTRQYLSLIDMTLNGMDQGIIFSRNNNELQIETDWTTRLPVGTIIIIECYQTIDPNVYPKIYNDQWLKQYASSLIKLQWAQNLSKFKGMTLPGGVQIDAEGMRSEALQEIKELETEARTIWEMPVDFYVG